MRIGTKNFTEDHTYVMGILNVTPDSFSDGGKFNDLDQALYHTQEMIAQGAEIIDVGGESTRPGYTLISDEEEIERTGKVIKEIKSRFDIPVSLDTYKGGVAKAGLEEGVDIINDIWGLQYDNMMGKVVANANVPYILMHNRKEKLEKPDFEIFKQDLINDINRALGFGIKKENIILDPGVGFAKTQEVNLMVMATLAQQRELGYPILLGASRKSVIHYVLDIPVEERLAGTLATTATAVEAGAMFVRVHDVKENVQLIKMMEEIRKRRIWNI